MKAFKDFAEKNGGAKPFPKGIVPEIAETPEVPVEIPTQKPEENGGDENGVQSTGYANQFNQ